MNKVPHCNECEHCEKISIVYTYLNCKREDKQICAGDSIKTSSKWCPRRRKING